MSEVHLHGVVAAADREAAAAAGARAVEHGELAAVVTDADEDGTKPAALVRRHWRVLEAISAGTTVLPVRFGTVMAGNQAVVDEFLAPGHDGLRSRLAALAGKVQLTVKGVYDEEALLRSIVEGDPTVAALRERVRALPEAASHFDRIKLGELVAAQVERARDRDTAHVLERLERMAVAASREPPSSLDSAVNTAFLVDRSAADEFGAAVGRLAEELEGRVQLRCVGPLPPYSFTDERAQGAPAWA